MYRIFSYKYDFKQYKNPLIATVIDCKNVPFHLPCVHNVPCNFVLFLYSDSLISAKDIQ